MPREKEYVSNAEKQRAYRERKRLELDAQTGEVVEFVEPPVREGRPAPPLEEYVARELEITRAFIASKLWTDEVEIKGRLDRSETYLRWRHAEFLAGRVENL